MLTPYPELTAITEDLRRMQRTIRARLLPLSNAAQRARERGHHRTAIALAGARGGLDGAVSTIELAIAELGEAIAYHETKDERGARCQQVTPPN